MKDKITYLYAILFCIVFASCKKDFLNEKPSTNIVQPSTLEDLFGLLENDLNVETPALPIISSDEYVFVDYAAWQGVPTNTERNAYIWAKNIYSGETKIRDWTVPYSAIFYANNVLQVLKDMPRTSENGLKYDYVKGWALFTRANSLFNLANTFCQSYDFGTNSEDLGLPLRSSPDIDDIAQRSSLSETYNQILSDLNSSKTLLSKSIQPTSKKNRPSLVACYGLLARISLNIRDYQRAELYADSCLALHPQLIDYNDIAPGMFPFSTDNEETIFGTRAHNSYNVSQILFNDFIKINPDLLNKYAPGDLRRDLYFSQAAQGWVMGGNYLGIAYVPFTGIATDEIYLMKSECAARRGEVALSLDKLNQLLEKRFNSGDFVPVTATSQAEALELILLERQKELVWRGLRWGDIKRLNKEGAGISITRQLNGIIYTLPPNDKRFALPIPDDEIALSGIKQNER